MKRINEQHLQKIISESIKKVLKEYNEEGGVVDIPHKPFEKPWDAFCQIRDINNNLSSNPKYYGAASYKEAFEQTLGVLQDAMDFMYELSMKYDKKIR